MTERAAAGAQFDFDDADAVAVLLPLTAPTGKIRVKRARPGERARSLAARQTTLADSDYLEWQIHYSELTSLAKEVRARGWVGDSRWRGVENRVRVDGDGFEEAETVAREESAASSAEFLSAAGFSRAEYRWPCYLKRGDFYEIEIALANRQRAIGWQAMVFVNLPIARCRGEDGASLLGRPAAVKERARYRIDRENAGLVVDALSAFALASRTHRGDLRRIFAAMEWL